jgi:mRNA interferase HigB
MRVISRRRLREFWEAGHADAEGPLRAWYHEAKSAAWSSPQEIKTRYPSASILPLDRVVFNIKGNTYRLVAVVKYRTKTIYIRFVGTHAEYDVFDVMER